MGYETLKLPSQASLHFPRALESGLAVAARAHFLNDHQVAINMAKRLGTRVHLPEGALLKLLLGQCSGAVRVGESDLGDGGCSSAGAGALAWSEAGLISARDSASLRVVACASPLCRLRPFRSEMGRVLLTSPHQVAVAVDPRYLGRVIGKGGRAINALRTRLMGASFGVIKGCFADTLVSLSVAGGKRWEMARLVARGPGLAQHKIGVAAILLAHAATKPRPPRRQPHRSVVGPRVFAEDDEKNRQGEKLARDKRKDERRRRRIAVGARQRRGFARRGAAGCGAAGWSGRGWRSNALEIDFAC